MRSILLFFLIWTVYILSFTTCQNQNEPHVEEDDELAAAAAQKNNNREPEPKYPDGVNTIPGSAEKDYPTYDKIWKTSFTCYQRPPGFYADVEARCQIWHTCDTRGHQQSFLCPNGTTYSQPSRVCDWWYNVNCVLEEVEKNYNVNDDLYQIPESAQNRQEGNNNNNEFHNNYKNSNDNNREYNNNDKDNNNNNNDNNKNYNEKKNLNENKNYNNNKDKYSSSESDNEYRSSQTNNYNTNNNNNNKDRRDGSENTYKAPQINNYNNNKDRRDETENNYRSQQQINNYNNNNNNNKDRRDEPENNYRSQQQINNNNYDKHRNDKSSSENDYKSSQLLQLQIQKEKDAVQRQRDLDLANRNQYKKSEPTSSYVQDRNLFYNQESSTTTTTSSPQYDRNSFYNQKPSATTSTTTTSRPIQQRSQAKRIITLPPVVLGREQILEILNSKGPVTYDDGLTDEERFPIKYKIRRQEAAEKERRRKLELAKQQQAAEQGLTTPSSKPQSLPVRELNQKPYKSAQQLWQAQGTTTRPPWQVQTTTRAPTTTTTQPPWQVQTTTQSPKPQPLPVRGSNQNTGPIKVRVVELDDGKNVPAIIRLINNFGVNPPKSTPQQQQQQQNRGFYKHDTRGSYVAASTTQSSIFRSTPPTTPIPSYEKKPEKYNEAYNRPRQHIIDNYVRPLSSQDDKKFEGTDETKFPQQQARQFPTSSNPFDPIIIQDPPINLQDGRYNTRYQHGESSSSSSSRANQQQQQQQERKRFNGDVNVDGNRFQNGETRQNQLNDRDRSSNSRFQDQESRQQRSDPRQQQQERSSRPQHSENPSQTNRYQNDEDTRSTSQQQQDRSRSQQQHIERGQSRPVQQQQQQTRNSNSYKITQQQDDNVHQHRRPRPNNNDNSPSENRRPIQEEQRGGAGSPIQKQSESRVQNLEPKIPQRNSVREFQNKPPGVEPPTQPRYTGPTENSHSSSSTHESSSYKSYNKFRHSTPRQHNVQFAPASRARDLEESQIPAESQLHPIPSFYNNHFQQPQSQQQQQSHVIEFPKSFNTPTTTTTTKTIEKTYYPKRPTPRPETVKSISNIRGSSTTTGNLSPSIVRIIVRKNNPAEPAPISRRVFQLPKSSDDILLDLRAEEELYHIEAAQGFGGRFKS